MIKRKTEGERSTRAIVVWQYDFANRWHRCKLGFLNTTSPLPVVGPGPCLVQCFLDHMSVPAKWCLIPSNGFSRVHESDRRTDHGTVTSDAVGRIAFSSATYKLKNIK